MIRSTQKDFSDPISDLNVQEATLHSEVGHQPFVSKLKAGQSYRKCLYFGHMSGDELGKSYISNEHDKNITACANLGLPGNTVHEVFPNPNVSAYRKLFSRTVTRKKLQWFLIKQH